MLNDIRYGIRSLLKRPGFSLVAIITLALGIGANSAIFSVTDKLLVRTLPVNNPEELFLVRSISVSPYFVSNAFSYPDYADYRNQTDVLAGLIAFSRTELELKTNEGLERIPSEYVSDNYFEVLGVNAALGRALQNGDDATGPKPQVVISEAFRQRRFGPALNPVGQQLVLNDVPLTIVGVAPKQFGGLTLERPAEMWVPVTMHPQLSQSTFLEKRTDRWLQLLGRLKPGVSASQAQSSLDLLAQHVKEANTPPGVITRGLPFSEQHINLEYGGKGISILRQRFSAPLKLLMIVVALVLLIACANVASLLLARGVSQKKEIAIRLSLGASSLQIVRQLLIESLLLAVSGGIAGLILAPWLVALLVRSQSHLTVAQTFFGETLDLRVLAFTSLTTLIAGLIFGLLPAWQSSRTELVPVLKDDGGTVLGERRHYLRSFLVVGQLSIAIVVLIGAGLCIKSLRNLLAIEPGYQVENILIVPLDLDEKKYDAARGAAFQNELLEKLRATPRVDRVSYGLVIPFSDSRYMSSLFVEGRQPLANEQMAFDASTVGPTYHETMGMKLLAGRGFTERDREGANPVVVINEALANRLFPGESAIGRRVATKTNGPGMEVVGVIRDVKYHDLTESPLPHFDLPSAQRGYDSYTNLVLRTRGPAVDLIPVVRQQLIALDPTLQVKNISAMSEQIGAALAATRLASSLITLFGGISLMMAALGVYGLMAWLVLRRTRELGIRLALGAQRGNLIGLILRQGLWLTLCGVVIGLSAAVMASRVLDTQQLYQVKATDPFTFVCVALLLTLVSLLACFIPAVRATKVDPLEALRYE